MERDDRDLVAAAQRGDRTALDDLLRRHHDRVHAICRRMFGNTADAQDATQDALIALVRGLDRFDGRAAFTTWLYRVTTNACIDELRRRRRRPDPGLPEGEPSLLAGADNRSVTAADPSPDGVALRLDIDAALARLPEEFRVAVVLRDLCDLDYADIAEVLEIPPGTVRSRIARGRAQLARHLGPGNPTAAPERPSSRP